VHLTGTPIWCDARRRRDVCFVSSADRVGRAGHGQLIGTPITLALIGAKQAGHLAVPLHRPFTLGTLRLELIPSGRGLGAAALHVDLGSRSVLYAGAVRTSAGEVRACDAVVVDAPVGLPHHRFESVDVVLEQLVAWVTSRQTAGALPILLVDNVLDGFEVAARFAASGFEVAATRSLREAAALVADAPKLVAVPPRAQVPARMIVMRVEPDKIKLANTAMAVVSARAVDAPQQGFAWPFVAGRDQLLAWIEQTRAKDVFVTGACADAIAKAVGARARVLGPPQQMALFGS
jgi:hypothetical protein